MMRILIPVGLLLVRRSVAVVVAGIASELLRLEGRLLMLPRVKDWLVVRTFV